jgi:hypothetical protein
MSDMTPAPPLACGLASRDAGETQPPGVESALSAPYPQMSDMTPAPPLACGLASRDAGEDPASVASKNALSAPYPQMSDMTPAPPLTCGSASHAGKGLAA